MQTFTRYTVIPGFSNYGITRDGIVMNYKNGAINKGSVGNSGYLNHRLKHDNGNYQTIGLHRLLALTFIINEMDKSKLYVNHINGLKLDNRVENLEWVTPKENVEHAGRLGITTKCKPMSIRNYSNGVVVKFNSILECSVFLGLSKDAVMYRLRFGEVRLFPERIQYRIGHDDGPWVQPEIIDDYIQYGTSKAVLVRELDSGLVTEFDKLNDVANHYGVSPSTVTGWLYSDDMLVVNYGIQIKRKNNPDDWVAIPDFTLEIIRRSIKKKVVVINVISGEKLIYDSAADCARDLRIGQSTLNYRLNNDNPTPCRDGCIYRYLERFEQSTPPVTDGL